MSKRFGQAGARTNVWSARNAKTMVDGQDAGIDQPVSSVPKAYMICIAGSTAEVLYSIEGLQRSHESTVCSERLKLF
jgi:hypothetical protein